MRFLHTHVCVSPPGPQCPAEDAADDDLVAQARDDRRVFAALYGRYFASVYGYCLSELRDPESAADAASQTFLQALDALGRYRAENRFRSWLFTIAHNVLLDTRRREQPIAALGSIATIVDPLPRPEDRALMTIELETLDAALAQLPDDDRRVLELRRAGLRGKDIGEVLGIGHAAARQRQVRALNRLRAALGAPIHVGASEVHSDV